VKDLIHKDVKRTMQDISFFKSRLILDNMEELLFVWAKANPEYKY
jgi:TBC1 domain family protein 5